MSLIRVFINYSHRNEELVEKIEKVLKANGLTPMFDRNFAFGFGFHEQIKRFIGHAHVFLPVVTPKAAERGWVQQEIGYAMAMNVPILPLAIGAVPGEMIGALHAVKLPRKIKERELDLRLSQLLIPPIFERLIQRKHNAHDAQYVCAALPEDRTTMMVEYADGVEDIQEGVPELSTTSFVRQKGALSSFHIPDKPLSDEVWKQRYVPHQRSAHHTRLQREERRALTRHAARSGCRLIVEPDLQFKEYDPIARRVRLESLVEFLKSGEVERVEIAFHRGTPGEQSLTIVGDWFLAESRVARPGHGYDQTIFTRHAPSMKPRIASFDEEFAYLLEECRFTAASSRCQAIGELRKIIDSLPPT